MKQAAETPQQVGPNAGEKPMGGLSVAMNPALQTLMLMSIVSLATWTGVQANDVDPFMLQAPLTEEWWQLPLSVYAHSSPDHLTGNATVILIAGGIISLSTSWFRFHLFFLSSGILAGVSHVAVTDAMGTAAPVLGASGAAFALVGYLLTSNTVSSAVLEGASIRVVLSVAAGVALFLTIQSAGMEIANLAHFTGAAIGLLSGHFNLLRPQQWGLLDRVSRS
ncbi:rhomboid family intramembrane serine protease [Natrinema sp. DC36]|uniref:rhomboid family intramembrane serine protease n=1 Tax=Natrinema sp. DC36 TaxID=2878680 RepID=UPI001CF07D48|nr:rhomboid family intramembrane serine protease [Natrinema sp. DC36]